jgi:hypothetical protein
VQSTGPGFAFIFFYYPTEPERTSQIEISKKKFAARVGLIPGWLEYRKAPNRGK